MNSELLSGGLQPNLFHYFSEKSLKDMAKYAKIGQVNDVLTFIEEAIESTEQKKLEDRLSEEDVRLRQIIHKGRDEFVDYICRGLQLKLKKKIGP